MSTTLQSQLQAAEVELARLRAAAEAEARKPSVSPEKVTAGRVQRLRQAAAKLQKTREAEAKAWDEARALMRELHALGAEDGLGPTYVDLSEIFGFTKARAYQLVTGTRGDGKDAAKYVPTPASSKRRPGRPRKAA